MARISATLAGRLFAVSLPALAGACQQQPTVRPLSDAPAELAPQLQRANTAIDELGRSLLGRLQTELARGPEAAATVCATDAQRLTAEIAAKHRLALGRTSHRVRNSANSPRPWVAHWLAQHENEPASAATAGYLELGDRVGLVRPIATGALCLTCHGDAQSISEPVKQVLSTRYPADLALGFAAGDLRGAFWAEVER